MLAGFDRAIAGPTDAIGDGCTTMRLRLGAEPSSSAFMRQTIGSAARTTVVPVVEGAGRRVESAIDRHRNNG